MQDNVGNRLVQIQVVHRHGARAPESGPSFPSICGALAFRPFITFTPRLSNGSLHPRQPVLFNGDGASCYAGQLTPLGAAQMYALGARLRSRYSGLLSEKFSSEVVEVRSTAMRRTVESALATLSGMFGGERGVVDVEVKQWENETMIQRRGCERLKKVYQLVRAGFVLPEKLGRVEGFVEGGGSSSRGFAMRDNALARRGNGLERVEWEDEVESAVGEMIMGMNGGDTWGLKLGKFVEELLNNAENWKQVGWKVKLFSGHDTTLLPMMACFEGSVKRGVPEFAADAVLETWVDQKNEVLVRLQYEGEDVVIDGCERFGGLCPLKVVKQAMKKRIPEDFEAACNTPSRKPSGKSKRAKPAQGTTFA